MAHGPCGGLLADLARVRDARTARVSSWNQGGRNADYWIIMPGETAVLADLEGPGCITHIWMTQRTRFIQGADWEEVDPGCYRKVLVKITWDDQEHPSGLAPLGGFFCLGRSICSDFATIPFTSSAGKGREFATANAAQARRVRRGSW
ncbi:MAG: DUF2961 domain-containing protein [Chloroflexi bacterium]|nr:DUF2961 domain-containing protein [Chloroflexota bacterium]